MTVNFLKLLFNYLFITPSRFRAAIDAGWPSAGERRSRSDVPLLCLLHRLRLILHSQPVHRCHHRQFQHAEEKSEYAGWPQKVSHYHIIKKSH